MSNKNNDATSTTFPKKYQKIIDSLPEFKDKAEAADQEELNEIIVKCEGNIFNVEKAKEEDVKLNATKDLLKDLSSGYKDAIKEQTARIKYCLFLLEGKGKELGDKEEE